MTQIYYPAVFHISSDVDGYWIEFPNLDGCFSQGSSIEEAMANSKEALGLYLDQSEDLYKRIIPTPSDINEIKEKFPNELIIPVEYDSLKYAQMFNTKAIKKTLSIPEWLNNEALKKGINFSQVLQEALISKLNSN